GPRQERKESPALADHFFGTDNREELDEFRAAGGLEAFQKIGERESDPRHHDRPAFNTAMAVDPFFERVRLEDVLERVEARLAACAFNRHRPRFWLEGLGVP